MKVRGDGKLLSLLVENKVISMEESKEMSALALMEVPKPQELPAFNDWIKVSPMKLEQDKIHLEFEHFPHYEMVFFVGEYSNFCKVDKNNIGGGKCWYCKLKVIDKDTVQFGFTDDPRYWVTCVLTDEKEKGTGIRDINVKIASFKKGKIFHDLEDKIIDKHFYPSPGLPTQPQACLAVLMLFSSFNNQLDRYIISVTKEFNKKKLPNNRDGLIAKVAGPRIIYLDKLPEPTDQDPESIGFGSPKAPHQRRGTWVTLRAERYKNHPLYQIEKAIYRKPAWIGDRTRIVHGATYTVIDKQVNFEE